MKLKNMPFFSLSFIRFHANPLGFLLSSFFFLSLPFSVSLFLRVGEKILNVNTSGIYRGKYSDRGIIPNTPCPKVFTSSKYYSKYPKYLLSLKIIPVIFPTLLLLPPFDSLQFHSIHRSLFFNLDYLTD